MVVSECTIERLGDLPFDFSGGTCGTFMIDSLPTVVLCFYENDYRMCRSLTQKNDGVLSDFNDFEFEIDRVAIPDSTHYHMDAKIANYQGLPLILGGWSNDGWNKKLEVLNTMKTPLRWVEYEGTPWPYSSM